MTDVLDKNSNIEVIYASLIYQIDSKGFYQPVYDFTVNIDEDIDNHIYIYLHWKTIKLYIYKFNVLKGKIKYLITKSTVLFKRIYSIF